MGLNQTERTSLSKALRRHLDTAYDSASEESRVFIASQIEQYEKYGLDAVEDLESFMSFLEEAIE